MCETHDFISLGFAGEKVPVGTHMCQIYTDSKEKDDFLYKFLLSGLKNNERSACFSYQTGEKELADVFTESGLSYASEKLRNSISFDYAKDVYFEDGCFDPERMLENLKNFYDETCCMDFSAARVIGEMLPEIVNIPGGERLLEYESKVSLLVREKPVTSVCQYNASLFDGATILEVLKVHPQMIVNGTVLNNPFFIPPEKYLNDFC